jgi:hypothetical protein
MGRDLNSSQLVAGVALLTCLSTAVYGLSKAPVSQSTGTSGLSAIGVTSRAPIALATSQTSSPPAVDSCTAITQSEARREGGMVQGVLSAGSNWHAAPAVGCPQGLPVQSIAGTRTMLDRPRLPAFTHVDE